jgi:hypothetical protein
MPRIVVQLALAAGMPRPLNSRCPSLFGGWLRERIASIAIDWPAVGFHRIELLPDGVRLVLLPQAGTPLEAVGLAIARAVRVEVESAALSSCGLQHGVMWDDHIIVIVVENPTAGNRAPLVLSEATATRLRSRRTSCRR